MSDIQEIIDMYKKQRVGHPEWWPFSREEADALVAEIERLRAEAERFALAVIQERNPGIDMARVKEIRASQKARHSAAAAALQEPQP